MDIFERARQVPRRIRMKAVRYGVIAVAVGAACVAAPVLAHDGAAKPPAPACGATLPLNTPCTPTVTKPGEPGAPYLVNVPGVGSFSFILDPATNKITAATVTTVGANFTASTPKISADGTKVTVTFTNSADPTQVYRVKVKVKAPETAGGAPVIKAKVRGAADWHAGEHRHRGGEREGGR
jgi:hypothetical protein